MVIDSWCMCSVTGITGQEFHGKMNWVGTIILVDFNLLSLKYVWSIVTVLCTLVRGWMTSDAATLYCQSPSRSFTLFMVYHTDVLSLYALTLVVWVDSTHGGSHARSHWLYWRAALIGSHSGPGWQGEYLILYPVATLLASAICSIMHCWKS